MHGAGYGTCDNSFGDVASGMASAGFVTAVLDKPVWNTTDVNRDYPASAKAYDQVIEYLRDQSDVDEAKVGIYATSESTWISSYLLEDDPDIAFQILLSPMVFSPRQSLGFFVTQDFTLVGANEGYQSIVQRVFSADTGRARTEQFRPRHTQTRRLRRTHLCGLRFERRDDGAGRRRACDLRATPTKPITGM